MYICDVLVRYLVVSVLMCICDVLIRYLIASVLIF